MGKGSTRRKAQIEDEKFANQWDAIFGIKKNPETLQDHVWNDKMKDMQKSIDLAMLEGDKKETK